MSWKWPPNASHFWMLWAPQITNNQEKRALKKTLKIGCKKYHMMTSKTRYFFARKTTLKSQKSKISSKWASRPPKWAPGPQKSSKNEPPGLQNHLKSWESGDPKARNLVTQNQTNLGKKTSRFPGNKDAARWRVMRAAHWIVMKTFEILPTFFKPCSSWGDVILSASETDFWKKNKPRKQNNV